MESSVETTMEMQLQWGRGGRRGRGEGQASGVAVTSVP